MSDDSSGERFLEAMRAGRRELDDALLQELGHGWERLPTQRSWARSLRSTASLPVPSAKRSGRQPRKDSGRPILWDGLSPNDGKRARRSGASFVERAVGDQPACPNC